MLSRIAEALYWVGRYTERAEDTARLLDVAHRASLEGRGGDDPAARESIANILGGSPVDHVLTAYALDRAMPESIASCVRQARESARTIRDAVTSEMWEALNTWHLAVSATGHADLEGAGAHRFFSSMKERSFLFTGTADGTMLREEGWQWLTIGRYLERVVFTCRVLGARSGLLMIPTGTRATASETFGWTVLLRSLSAHEAYRKTYRNVVDPRRIAEFLLLDPDLPRSALYSARHVEEGIGNVTVDGSHARRTAGRLRADLEYRQVSEVLDEGVAPFVGRLLSSCFEVHDDLVTEAFARGSVVPA
ncbi:MAG TPA: alpha-E domain-containing protein [Frankiaceae bacterium]|jgi:uncharacterized alpha-E superfamily protein|nr:alpha-E domain-containing protein [Frankiaceae bacterium]